MSKKYADLHIHTSVSDGHYSPEQVVEHASRLGFAAISICDHDAVEGTERAIAAGNEIGIEVIPGVELSTSVEQTEGSGSGGQEIHIIGYFIDWHDEELTKMLDDFRQYRVTRMEKMVEKLNHLGCKIDIDKLTSSADTASIGRMHLAQALLTEGYVRDLREAFDRYLAFGKPAYMEKFKITPKQACDLIKRIGGIPVLAHPYLFHNDDMVSQLIDDGIMGIEAFYSKMPDRAVQYYIEMARSNNLLITGGSDCHQYGDYFLMGTVKLPYKYVERLKQKWQEIARK